MWMSESGVGLKSTATRQKAGRLWSAFVLPAGVRLPSSGYTPKIFPAQFVKPYVKSNKNDMVDAAAIAEYSTHDALRADYAAQARAINCVSLVLSSHGMDYQEPRHCNNPGFGSRAATRDD
jgi:hypothetical protein